MLAAAGEVEKGPEALLAWAVVAAAAGIEVAGYGYRPAALEDEVAVADSGRGHHLLILLVGIAAVAAVVGFGEDGSVGRRGGRGRRGECCCGRRGNCWGDGEEGGGFGGGDELTELLLEAEGADAAGVVSVWMVAALHPFSRILCYSYSISHLFLCFLSLSPLPSFLSFFLLAVCLWCAVGSRKRWLKEKGTGKKRVYYLLYTCVVFLLLVFFIYFYSCISCLLPLVWMYKSKTVL